MLLMHWEEDKNLIETISTVHSNDWVADINRRYLSYNFGLGSRVGLLGLDIGALQIPIAV